MGKLISSQKTIAGVSGLIPNTFYKVKSLLGGTYLYEIFNASDNYAATIDTIQIWQNGDINSTPIIALNNDPEWIDAVSEQNIDNTLIPVGSVILINSYLNHSYAGAVLVNYFQGKTNIKKQNLSILKPGNLNPDAVYVFKSATTNLLGTIFNQAQFGPYSDGLTIYTEGSLTGANSVFFTDGSTWVYDDYSTNADAYVIPANSILLFSTSNDLNITIGGGAIIQKYYGGKLKLSSSVLPDYIFSYNNYISLQTECFYDGDYYATPADPYQISFNVNLPKKPKQVQVKLKGIGGDDLRYAGIVLTNPDNKTCFINQYNNATDGRVTNYYFNNALVTDDAQYLLFQTGVGGLLSNDITGRPYVKTGNMLFNCGADYYAAGYIEVDNTTSCQATMGLPTPPCPPVPEVITGFTAISEGLVAGGNRRLYYTKLNKLINNNYNGTWKFSLWNHWSSEPDDVQNGIQDGIDLIFKF